MNSVFSSVKTKVEEILKYFAVTQNCQIEINCDITFYDIIFF